jgi:hypothetical protein
MRHALAGIDLGVSNCVEARLLGVVQRCVEN